MEERASQAHDLAQTTGLLPSGYMTRVQSAHLRLNFPSVLHCSSKEVGSMPLQLEHYKSKGRRAGLNKPDRHQTVCKRGEQVNKKLCFQELH